MLFPLGECGTFGFCFFSGIVVCGVLLIGVDIGVVFIGLSASSFSLYSKQNSQSTDSQTIGKTANHNLLYIKVQRPYPERAGASGQWEESPENHRFSGALSPGFLWRKPGPAR